jgi:hypothetical protein
VGRSGVRKGELVDGVRVPGQLSDIVARGGVVQFYEVSGK